MTTHIELISQIESVRKEIRAKRIANIKECKQRRLEINSEYVRCLRIMDKLVVNMLDEVYGSK